MINDNGNLTPSQTGFISSENRAFKYGDSIFTTVKVERNRVIFWEDHYFRLMASMRMLRMEIPMAFTLSFLEEEILRTVDAQPYCDSYRVRLTIYRKDGGFYTPITNDINYLVVVKQNDYKTKNKYLVDLYKDFYNYSGLLSTVKTNNRMLNTLAGIYAKENELDNCILVNDRKGVAEVINGNIFIVGENVVKTPSLEEGCIQGVIRKKVIEIIEKYSSYTLEQTNISPFEIQKSTEVFITNSIIGIQPITHYRKKVFETKLSEKLQKDLLTLYN